MGRRVGTTSWRLLGKIASFAIRKWSFSQSGRWYEQNRAAEKGSQVVVKWSTLVVLLLEASRPTRRGERTLGELGWLLLTLLVLCIGCWTHASVPTVLAILGRDCDEAIDRVLDTTTTLPPLTTRRLLVWTLCPGLPPLQAQEMKNSIFANVHVYESSTATVHNQYFESTCCHSIPHFVSGPVSAKPPCEE